jgi:Aldehyde dehydrogenase family
LWRRKPARWSALDPRRSDVESDRPQTDLHRLDRGRQIADGAVRRPVKKVSLELGGNAPFIVFDDADIEMAVKGAIASKYRNAGQTCVCANRILVQDGVYDAFTKRLAETAGAMKVADGFESGAVIGPLIDMKAVEKVEAHIADALRKGAKVVTGGKRAAQGGSFFEPTVLTDVTTDMVITKEETFGPAAPLYRFKSEADAVKMPNDTPTLTLPRACGGGKGGGRLLFLQPRRRSHLARRRGPRIRHRRHQRGHHLDRDCVVRRHEGKRHRPIWRSTVARNTASRNSSKSNTSAWAASTGNIARTGPARSG